MTHHLTDSVRSAILRSIRRGHLLERAAQDAQIPVSTLRDWCRRGRDNPESPYGDLNHQIRTALREATLRRVRLCSRAIATARYRYGQPEDEIAFAVYLSVMKMLEEGRVLHGSTTDRSRWSKPINDEQIRMWAHAKRGLELAISELEDHIADEQFSWYNLLDE